MKNTGEKTANADKFLPCVYRTTICLSWKALPLSFEFVICNPCQSSPHLPSLLLCGLLLSLCCISILVNYNFHVSFNLKSYLSVIHNILTELGRPDSSAETSQLRNLYLPPLVKNRIYWNGRLYNDYYMFSLPSGDICTYMLAISLEELKKLW